VGAFKRYYIRNTGMLHGRNMGEILNRDGSVYTGDMSDTRAESEDYTNKLPALVSDGWDIIILNEKETRVDLRDIKANLVFYQDTGHGKEAVASIRLTGTELDNIRGKLLAKIDELNIKPRSQPPTSS
jgi:hypothetical protein